MAAAVGPKPAGQNPEEDYFGVAGQVGAEVDYTVPNPLDPPSGFTSYSVEEMRAIREMREALNRTYQLYGFTPFDPPPVQYAKNLLAVGGMKEIFGVSRLQGAQPTKYALPFDRTVPLALFLAKNFSEVTFPFARSDIEWVFRGEKAAPGRYRGFIQADVDVVGPQVGPDADAQCIAALVAGLRALKVPHFSVLLNHVDIAKSFLRDAGIRPDLYKDALRVIDKLKPDNREAVVTELIEKVPGMARQSAEQLLDKMSYRGPLSGFQYPGAPSEEAARALQHLQQVVAMAGAMGVPADCLQFSANLARGLTYYTGIVFETFIQGHERYGSVASGGRYDNLVEDFKPGLKLQGVGGSIGLTRLFDVLKALKVVDLTRQTTAQVYVCSRESSLVTTAVKVATALREKGIFTELSFAPQKIKAELGIAANKGIPYVVMVMQRKEIVVRRVFVRDNESEDNRNAEIEQESYESIEEVANRVAALTATQPMRREEAKE